MQWSQANIHQTGGTGEDHSNLRRGSIAQPHATAKDDVRAFAERLLLEHLLRRANVQCAQEALLSIARDHFIGTVSLA